MGKSYADAKEELSNVLRNQKTVSVPKLLKLLNALNVSLEPDKNKDKEVAFLKGKLKERDKKLEIMREQIKKWKNE